MDWQSLAILAFGLCPSSLLLGLIAGVWLVRQLGVKWPWEQSATMDSNPRPRVIPERPRPGDTFSLPRVPMENVGKCTAEMLVYGWRFLRQDRVEATNLFDLSFVWLGE